jgi:dTDP-4-amino-4,6-dideoxygalactose transaminase
VTRHPTFGLSAEDQARFPEAERAYEHLISLPLYAGLTDDAQDYVVAMLKEALHS